MKARIAGTTDNAIWVQLWDNENREHRVKLNWDGNVAFHEQDAFPVEESERTAEQEDVIQQVRLRAKYAAQFETDADVLAPDWNPAILEDAIEAIERLDSTTFDQYFREYYHEVQEPSVDVPVEQVRLITKGLRVENAELVDVGPVAYHVERGPGDLEWLGGGDTIDANVVLHVPPLEIESGFGERFREYLVHHLRCQVRDVFVRMGEQPPEEYQVDGYGKPVVEEG